MKRLILALCFLAAPAGADEFFDEIHGLPSQEETVILPGPLEAFECEITSKNSGGFVGDVVLFSFAGDQAAVYDWAIDEVYEGPIAVKITMKSEKYYKLRWKVEGLETATGVTTDLSYRARLNRETHVVSLNGTLHGYDNAIGGRGKCKGIKP